MSQQQILTSLLAAHWLVVTIMICDILLILTKDLNLNFFHIVVCHQVLTKDSVTVSVDAVVYYRSSVETVCGQNFG